MRRGFLKFQHVRIYGYESGYLNMFPCAQILCRNSCSLARSDPVTTKSYLRFYQERAIYADTENSYILSQLMNTFGDTSSVPSKTKCLLCMEENKTCRVCDFFKFMKHFDNKVMNSKDLKKYPLRCLKAVLENQSFDLDISGVSVADLDIQVPTSNSRLVQFLKKNVGNRISNRAELIAFARKLRFRRYRE